MVANACHAFLFVCGLGNVRTVGNGIARVYEKSRSAEAQPIGTDGTQARARENRDILSGGIQTIFVFIIHCLLFIVCYSLFTVYCLLFVIYF